MFDRRSFLKFIPAALAFPFVGASRTVEAADESSEDLLSPAHSEDWNGTYVYGRTEWFSEKAWTANNWERIGTLYFNSPITVNTNPSETLVFNETFAREWDDPAMDVYDDL